MRSTFEARGYTAWDPNVPLFIIEESNTRTLCIPSVFVGYHGQALDNKTPLLRSLEALNNKACDFLKLLGDVDIKSASVTLGPEQEYFLVDKATASKRPDLVMTGRTLLGATSKRGQKLEDHYFGSIPTRVKAFMDDMEKELHRLGVPVKTRHNEVAPSQFEMAPIFETAAMAADHNTLAMETMKRVASRHGLMCLTHEKPFAGVNGSGKHCNWSICNDKGENLLDPGRTPHQNLRFLAIVAVVLKAVHERSGVLAATITSPGNDLRLGGNEAPPTIVSVYLGEMLERIFSGIGKGEASEGTETQLFNLGVSRLPSISRDYSDRNRTSPFAFTGNKFEFRAVGASAPVAVPVYVLNAAVAQSLEEATTRLKSLLSTASSRDEAVMLLVRELYEKHRAIVFNGNNYSAAWREEAKKRGLPMIDSCADGFPTLGDEAANQFLIDMQVLSKDEIKSRFNVKIERYNRTLEIELSTLSEMVMDFVLPAVEKQLRLTTEVLIAAKSKDLKTQLDTRQATLEQIRAGLLSTRAALDACLKKVSETHDEEKQMLLTHKEAMPLGVKLRAFADAAETEVADEFWSLPKYRDLLFHHSMR